MGFVDDFNIVRKYMRLDHLQVFYSDKMKKINCDSCTKDVDVENAYTLKVRKNDTGLTKEIDVCHPCMQEKGFQDVFAGATWKKWKNGKWVIPE